MQLSGAYRGSLGDEWNMLDRDESEQAIASDLAYAHELNWFLITKDQESELKARGLD